MTRKYHQGLPPPPAAPLAAAGAIAAPLERDIFGNPIPPHPSQPQAGMPSFGDQQQAQPRPPREKATDALGRRAGALLDEIDFPSFVASLVDGTFNGITDSAIRQMEAYSDLIAAVAKPLDQFARENVTRNQARDWLAEQYPSDVDVVNTGAEYQLTPRATDEEEFSEPPSWLADFGLEGNELSGEFLEETLLPAARERVAQQRLSTLATMVLTGMNRVVVRDGTIGARLRFRAAASDNVALDFATSNDPSTGQTEWGRRGARRGAAVTKVSTIDVNAQSDSELEARLYGDVKINFASETLPLDRFMDQAEMAILERHSRNRAAIARAQKPTAQQQPAPQQSVGPAEPPTGLPPAPNPQGGTG
ncbi:hypothetical protein [Ruegeria sp. Ofav3-42]|uniref:hypothetical protein n=1 Tax=Ruegeria sp. Ofav3-42 TaxID=2917759 RepID=UPI001EF467C1|nr:hypothetical protein [Ruegeria sp. Ofav3-42]MCG7519842.1 hypothetical protein [Ruegeria sp. Ofav3-42]